MPDIDCDDQDECYRAGLAVVSESSECDACWDWPLDGEAVARQMGEDSSRRGGSRLPRLDRSMLSGGQHPQGPAVEAAGGGADAWDPEPQSPRSSNARRVYEEVDAENLRPRAASRLAPSLEGANPNADDIGVLRAPAPKRPPTMQRGGGEGLGATNG